MTDVRFTPMKHALVHQTVPAILILASSLNTQSYFLVLLTSFSRKQSRHTHTPRVCSNRDFLQQAELTLSQQAHPPSQAPGAPGVAEHAAAWEELLEWQRREQANLQREHGQQQQQIGQLI